MKYSILASGSKGNCCIVESQGYRIMIDCGTTKRYLTQKFAELSLTFNDIDVVLITHDHSDHTSQLKHFSSIPILGPEPLKFECEIAHPYHSITRGPFTITPIATSHDAEASLGYLLDDGNYKLVYITDTGYIREQDFNLIADATFYILESNHDPELLMQTKRPYAIKRRILSDTGHLSNEEAGIVLSHVVSHSTRQITLAHLSQEANNERLAVSTVKRFIANEDVTVTAAKQFEMVYGGIIYEK